MQICLWKKFYKKNIKSYKNIEHSMDLRNLCGGWERYFTHKKIKLEFQDSCDASNYVVGAILEQENVIHT